MKAMEAASDKFFKKVTSFGKAVAHSPLRLGLKYRAKTTIDHFNVYHANARNSKLDDKPESDLYCYSAWGTTPLEIRQGPNLDPSALKPIEGSKRHRTIARHLTTYGVQSDSSGRYPTAVTFSGQTVTVKTGCQMTPEHHALYDVSKVTSLSDLTRFVKYQCYQRGFVAIKSEQLPDGEVFFKCIGTEIGPCPFKLSYKGFAIRNEVSETSD